MQVTETEIRITQKVHFATAGEAVTVYDPGARAYRPSTLVDLYDTARLVDRLDNIHRYCQMVVATEIEDAVCIPAEDAIAVSAKTGLNVEQVLDAIVEKVPPPTGDPDGLLQALIFDAEYNDYRGVVVYIRILEGRIEKDMDPYRSARQMDTDEIVAAHELRDYLKTLVEMSYQSIGYRRVKNPRIWSMHDLNVLMDFSG